MVNLRALIASRLDARKAPETAVQVQTKKSLGDLIAERITSETRPQSIPEIKRICDLPIAYPLTDEEIAAVQAQHVKADAPNDFKLQRVQAEAFFAFDLYGSVFAPIEVGGGKTLISLRVVGMAYERGLRRSILCVPPQVYDQLTKHDIAWARQRVPIGCPFILMGGKTRSERFSLAASNTRGCFIVPYSLLSTEDTHLLLAQIKPQLLFLDEAHNLKNRKSARTKRILRYLKENPTTSVCCSSGTMTSKSIREFAHLIQACLGHGTPLPMEAQMVDDWAGVLDADRGETWDPTSHKVGTGPLRPLVSWSLRNFPHDRLEYDVEGFRRAFQNRLLTTPGVVASPADSLGASLIVQNHRVPLTGPGSEQVIDFMDRAESLWEAPNGDQIEWAMHKFKWMYELSSGFYNDLRWPDPDHLAKQKNIAVEVATERLERAQAHHLQLQVYHAELRQWLRYHQIDGCDTPMLVGNEMARHGPRIVGDKLFKLWREAKDLEFEDMPERFSVPVRLCAYKIRDGIEWAKQRAGQTSIVWYKHHGMGEWFVEEAQKHGLAVLHCPAGNHFNRMLADQEMVRGKTLVCSIDAHSTGKNLQYVSEQFCLQFPRPEETAQQLIGRTHRKGQLADEVLITTCISTPTDEVALAATLNDAVYVFETTSSRRKLLFATWDPLPTIASQEMLTRAGTEAKALNIRQRKILEEKFARST